ncbi:MAG TPA: oxidoreductase, partial [Chitinophagaceae bacterium]|nr:oxidoreductase [Chitinophagaceae bacterium]
PFDKRPVADSGEACFAASGTNIRPLDRDEAVFVSGGLKSRIFSKNGPTDLPIMQGKESTGANSVAVWDNKKLNGGKKMVIVGGDFNDASLAENNCFITNDGGKTWEAPNTAPHGYRSCVEFLSKKNMLTCGLNGVDFSSDAGRNWKWISKESFNVCRTAKLGSAVYLAGNNGRVAKLVWK